LSGFLPDEGISTVVTEAQAPSIVRSASTEPVLRLSQLLWLQRRCEEKFINFVDSIVDPTQLKEQAGPRYTYNSTDYSYRHGSSTATGYIHNKITGDRSSQRDLQKTRQIARNSMLNREAFDGQAQRQ
jgi:hypothetical protein